MIRETLDPIFNEDLYFLVRSFDPAAPQAHELAMNSVIEMCAWDYDDSGSSELMGQCNIFLHEITGCGAGGDPVTQVFFIFFCAYKRTFTHNFIQATQRLAIRRRQYPGAPLKTVTIQTRLDFLYALNSRFGFAIFELTSINLKFL